MLHTDAIAALARWEQRFGVAAWRVGEVPAWPIVRTALASRVLATQRLTRPSRRRALADVIGGVGAQLRHVRDRSSRQARLDPVDVLCLSRPPNRGLVDGVWYDRFFDPIAGAAAELGATTATLEYCGGDTRYRTPRRRPAFPVRGRVAMAMMSAAWSVRRRPAVYLDGLEALMAAVRAAYPEVAPVERPWIVRRAATIARAARGFEELMGRTRPRLALLSPYYNLVGMAFCLAAHRRGVPVVDMQHGVTVRNPAYEGWTAFADDTGYELLPDRFWCWTSEDTAPVNAWPLPGQRGFVGGHPWMAYWQDEPRVRALQPAFDRLRGEDLCVLVSLTWSSGLSSRLQQLVEASPASWRWWLRLHPLMDGDRARVRRWCERHARGRAFVDEPTDLPLPALLRRADVHLTHNSTVVQEAARLGTTTVLIDRRAVDVYRDELSSGWARFSDTISGTLDALREQAHGASGLAPLARYPGRDHLVATLAQQLGLSRPAESV